jgi:hypothetical protein
MEINGRIFQRKIMMGRNWCLVFTKMAIYTRSVNLIMENKTESGSFPRNENKEGIGKLMKINWSMEVAPY